MINNLLLEVLSTMAEQDRIRIKTTQSEGIRAAKIKGTVVFGRPKAIKPPNFAAEVALWRDNKQTAVFTMNKLSLKRTTFYNLVASESGV